MLVVRVAETNLSVDNFSNLRTSDWLEPDNYNNLSPADFIGEFGGRLCYQSWDRPNAKTATNQSYMNNILSQGHYSVLEHASVTYMVEGVSRSLLTELTRHRHLSLSVRSQRYVDESEAVMVVPPAIAELDDDAINEDWGFITSESKYYYSSLVDSLMRQGLKRKQARESARSVLPNATETSFIVTGNLRAWRDVLGKRYHPAADREIREFALEVLKDLKQLAPNSFQDIEFDENV